MHINLEDYSKLSDNEFVSAIYKQLLNRSADSGGRRHYLDLLSHGYCREAIVTDLIHSKEGKSHGVKVSNLKQIEFVRNLKTLLRKVSRHSQERKNNPKVEQAVTNNDLLIAGENIYKQNRILAENIKIIINQPAYDEYKNRIFARALNNKNIWFDLTTCFEWQGGIVGIIRAELEIAAGLYKTNKKVRYCVQVASGFVEIDPMSISSILTGNNITESYLELFGRLNKPDKSDENIKQNELVKLIIPSSQMSFSPFSSGDVFLSVGWIDSQKEKVLSALKESHTNIFIVYLVYDTILLHQSTKFFYSSDSGEKFKKYLKWISFNADLILCGGTNTKRDVSALQERFNWPIIPAAAIKFGADIINSQSSDESDDEVLKQLGINGRFIISVGTIEPRKNHITLYRAYLLVLEKMGASAPQLIFCGRPDGNVMDLINQIKRSVILREKLIIVSPTDTQLSLLYKHCLFTLLPSIYEGWSLALPESLNQGKFCIVSDVPPLREIANNIVDYVEPFNTLEWANKILHYSTNSTALAEAENRIARLWHGTTWRMCAANIFNIVSTEAEHREPRKVLKPIWFDLTTSFLHVPGVISGIIRVELSYAKYLNDIYPNVHYFAHANDKLFEITHDKLMWLFDGDDVAASFKFFYEFWSNHEANGTGSRVPADISSEKAGDVTSEIRSFSDNSIVFLVNIDWDLKWTKQVVSVARNSTNVLVSQFIHDATPIVVPHLHQEMTCEKFEPFFEFCSKEIDYLQYGGNVAQMDGIAIQRDRGWRTPPSDFIRLASDFKRQAVSNDVDNQCLGDMGVESKFLITVGTIEPRKNHEVLYKAYLKLIADNFNELPQLIFVGKPGWMSGDLLAILSSDQRIINKIKIITPNDFQLDVLYRNCLFALLPSYYEGYSLTLNECLSYGKFCLTSDVPPLREVGGVLVNYINPNDIYEWAKQIGYYSSNPNELAKKSDFVRTNWQTITWKDSSAQLLATAQRAQEQIFNTKNQ